MKRDGDIVSFTDEDKKYMVVKRYSKSEIESNQNKHRRGNNVRRLVFGLILFLLIALSYLTEQIEPIQFAANIGIVFMIFLIFLYEYIHRLDLKSISLSHPFMWKQTLKRFYLLKHI